MTRITRTRHWQNADRNSNRRVRGACPFDSFYVNGFFEKIIKLMGFLSFV